MTAPKLTRPRCGALALVVLLLVSACGRDVNEDWKGQQQRQQAVLADLGFQQSFSNGPCVDSNSLGYTEGWHAEASPALEEQITSYLARQAYTASTPDRYEQPTLKLEHQDKTGLTVARLDTLSPDTPGSEGTPPNATRTLSLTWIPEGSNGVC